jgi:hypothetical protein
MQKRPKIKRAPLLPNDQLFAPFNLLKENTLGIFQPSVNYKKRLIGATINK